jgi:small-conductance mechanosensitive channel
MSKSRQLPLLLAAVCLSFPGWGRPAETPENSKAGPGKTRKIDLHRLTNEELIKKATAIYDKASRDFLAQLRALAFAEMLLKEVQNQTGEVKASASATQRRAGQTPEEDAAKKAVDAARTRKDAAQRTLDLVRTQKQLLDRVTSGLEGCKSAALAFQNALDDLKAYALETELRVKDGTLAEDKVPDVLKPEFLQKKRQGVTDDIPRLKRKSVEGRERQGEVARLLEQAGKAALAADADVVEASKNLVREQRRQELEKTYTGKKPDEMVAELAGMVEEGIGLKGTYELALRKFDARAKEAARLRTDLDALRQPRAKIPQLTRAEDVTTAARSIQKLIAYYAARTKKIEKLRAALAGLAREGGEFEADAAVSEEHLFKMQVLAKLLLKKNISDDKLPEKARAAQLQQAALRQKRSASGVRATTAKAKAELALLDRQRAETGAAGQAAAKQLASLRESQDVTLAALKWEGRLKGMSSARVIKLFTTLRKQLRDRLGKLQAEADRYKRAVAAAAEAKARLDGLKDPFLRAAEEQGQSEKQNLMAELRKEAGLERASRPARNGSQTPPEGNRKKTNPDKKTKPDTRPELEHVADSLLTFQQHLAGRVRVREERVVKKKDLLAAQGTLKKRATAYAKTLVAARLLALELNAAAVDLKKRLGKGDLSGDNIPEGITDALRLETRTKLDASATSVLNGLQQLQQDQAQLLRPDPDEEALTAASKELLTLVGRRLDLLADLRRLAADYKKEKAARSPSEIKRLEQRAAERQHDESSAWDTLLGIDSSKTATNLSELLESYYRELIEIEEGEDNLKKQREKVDKLIELTQKETVALTRVLPMLAKQVTRLEAAREEEAVLARARLRPERAEELLKAYQTKTGRLLNKPLPVADREKAAKVEELGGLIFESFVRQEAAKKWAEVLNSRVAPAGVKAEAGVYQDELARITAASAANARRVHALTGRKQSDEAAPATGGEIGKTRAELADARTQGVKRIALRIGIILLAALLLPRILLWILWRLVGGTRGENSSLVFSALRAVLKVGVWVAALTMILSVLGFNVTAIIAGLGIGGLAIGLAAQPMIADVIGAVVIFVERRFKIGDVIRLGADEPARVVGLTWRSTQLKNAEGVLVAIPNRKVTEATIQNLTRAGRTYDSLAVSVITQKDAAQVLGVIERAMAECQHLDTDRGVVVQAFNQKGDTKTIKYRFSWFLMDYDARNKTRDEVFSRISASLAHEDMAGTEISLA